LTFIRRQRAQDLNYYYNDSAFYESYFKLASQKVCGKYNNEVQRQTNSRARALNQGQFGAGRDNQKTAASQ
jgi:hypothetical protein